MVGRPKKLKKLLKSMNRDATKKREEREEARDPVQKKWLHATLGEMNLIPGRSRIG